ncbi:PucR family transcriptional regulator [Rhodococcoides trifolii]|nr:PucR family transcriptional regulator [Rhodococcus trifolii]
MTTVADHVPDAPDVPSPADLAAGLMSSADVLCDRLVERILSAEHSYTESTRLTPEQLRGACMDNMVSMLRALSESTPMDLDSARAAGRLKAEQGVPLAALLHAFRLGGRMIWESLLALADGNADAALLAMAAEVWAIVDVYSDAAADAYREAADLRALEDFDSRRLLIRTLFGDRGSDPSAVQDALRAFLIPETGTFVVVSAEVSTDGVRTTATAESAVNALGVDSVWDTAVDGHLGLLCAGSAADLTTAVDALGSLYGSRIGVSGVFGRAHTTASAVEEARLARRCAPVGSTRVVRYDTAPVSLLLVRNPGAGSLAAQQILGPVLDLPADERDSLLGTLDAWFDARGSTAGAAERLHYHRNTILYRLRRIHDLTGRNFSDPVHAAELFVGLRSVQLLG